MLLPKAYRTFGAAAFLVDDYAHIVSFEALIARLSGALAVGDLMAHGIIVGSLEHDYDPPEMGELRPLRPEIWRTLRTWDAIAGAIQSERVYQDGFVLFPIIREAALFAWREADCASQRSGTASLACSVPGLSYAIHGVPAGYVTFDRVSSVARVWANNGEIDPGLMILLDPLDIDVMTEALATGSLRAHGIIKRTGAIVSLPPAIWRMEVNGAPQSVWAIRGGDVLAGPDGEFCLPVVSRAELARTLQARKVDPDPDELPEAPAVSLTRASPAGSAGEAVEFWMRGLAQGFKLLKHTLKRDDAVRAATIYLSCTTREAEAAYEALPYPELRNPPRTPRA
jgi:hypothetical protein